MFRPAARRDRAARRLYYGCRATGVSGRGRMKDLFGKELALARRRWLEHIENSERRFLEQRLAGRMPAGLAGGAGAGRGMLLPPGLGEKLPFRQAGSQESGGDYQREQSFHIRELRMP